MHPNPDFLPISRSQAITDPHQPVRGTGGCARKRGQAECPGLQPQERRHGASRRGTQDRVSSFVAVDVAVDVAVAVVRLNLFIDSPYVWCRCCCCENDARHQPYLV